MTQAQNQYLVVPSTTKANNTSKDNLRAENNNGINSFKQILCAPPDNCAEELENNGCRSIQINSAGAQRRSV